MSPPYRLAQFEIVYGVGIDKLKEVLELMNEYEIGRKYGKTMTYKDIKYDLEEFKNMIVNDEAFHADILSTILNKIKNADIKQEEHVEDQL
jgi:hypothetical protein